MLMLHKQRLAQGFLLFTTASAAACTGTAWFIGSSRLLMAAGMTSIAGIIIYTIAGFRLAHSVRARFAMLQHELNHCEELGYPITIPSGNRDEIDAMITGTRNFVRTSQERLHTARLHTASYMESNSLFHTSIRQATSTLTALSALTTGLKGRLSAFDQMLKNAEEGLSILQLKTERLKGQGENQAVQVTETTSAIEEIHASINTITERAETRQQHALELRNTAQQDARNIRSARDNILEIMKEIGGVTEILAVIDAISEQTSQLSLNAFIESAHGSENNKGFEVVATEIRQLADSTAENADGISTLLHRIDDHIREASFFSEKSQHSFKTSVEVITEFAESMHTIAEHMRFTNSLSDNVVSEAQALSLRADEIRELSSSVNEMTESGKQHIQQTRMNTNTLEKAVSATDSAVHELNQWITSTQESVRLAERYIREINQKLHGEGDT
ncbi:MAG: methyl-accepting chemotaxis protein [Spirochaeta sp.]